MKLRSSPRCIEQPVTCINVELAQYGIILNKQMMGMFTINLGVSVALLMLLKKQFPVVEKETQKQVPKLVKYVKKGLTTVFQLGLLTTSVYSLQFFSSHMSLICGLEHGAGITAVKIFTDICLLGSAALLVKMRNKHSPARYA